MQSILLSNAFAASAGSVVVGLLWQGTVVGVLVALALIVARDRSPNLRYALACTGLLLIAALLPVNFVWLATRDVSVPATADWQVAVDASHDPALPKLALDPTDPTDPTDRSDPSDSSALDRPARPRLSAVQWYHRCLPWLGRLWAVGIVCFALYDLAGVFALRRLRAKSQAVGQDIAALALRVQERLGVRVRVQVRWLAGISSALVTGFFRTVILLPASMATRMTPDEIEAILAHEFAHIRRWDMWVNAFQRVVEALLFFHPVVWWLSSTIRNERERCCDELALRAYPDRAQYVRALLTLAETSQLSETLALYSHGGSLAHRVRKILYGRDAGAMPVRGRWAALAVTAAVLLVLIGADFAGARIGSEDSDTTMTLDVAREAVASWKDRVHDLTVVEEQVWFYPSGPDHLTAQLDYNKMETVPGETWEQIANAMASEGFYPRYSRPWRSTSSLKGLLEKCEIRMLGEDAEEYRNAAWNGREHRQYWSQSNLGSIADEPTRASLGGLARNRMLGWINPEKDLSYFLNLPTAEVVDASIEVNGFDCVAIRITEGITSITHYLSPAHDWLPVRSVTEDSTNPASRIEYEVWSFARHNGFWFPSIAESGGKIRHPNETETAITRNFHVVLDVQVNTGLTDVDFDLEYPEGTTIHDWKASNRNAAKNEPRLTRYFRTLLDEYDEIIRDDDTDKRSAALNTVRAADNKPGSVPEDVQATGSNVLESMRAYDDAVLDNMVLEAHVTHPLIIEKLDSEPSLLQVRITRRGNTWAYRADLDESQPPPSYVPHSEEHGMGLSADPASGDNIVARPLRTTLLSDPEFNGIYEEKVVYEVSPGGSVKESLSPHSVEIALWPNPIHDWHIYIPVLASGHGFSLLLDEITETEVADDGLLHCKAVGVSPGSSGRASPATWDLLIEPDAGYLVRRAAASLPNGNVFWEFENEGLRKTSKGSVPRSASFRYGGNQASEMYQGEGKTEIVYTGLDDGADDALIADARRLLNGPYPPGTRVSDRRGKATGSSSSSADLRKSSPTSSAERENALAVIRGAEQAYEFAHVTAKMVAFEPDGGGVLMESGEFVHTEGNLGFYSPLQFDCLVDGRMGQSLRSFQERVSADGRDLRYLAYGRRNTGQFMPSNGAVLPKTRLDKVEFTLLRGGINLFLPSYAGCGLSTYIERIPRQMPAWRVLDHTETSLVIWIPTHDTREDHARNEHSFVIGLDLTKGGNIARWEEWFDYWGPNRRLRQILQSGEFKQLNGLWFPTKLTVDVVDDDRAQGEILIRREIAEFEWSEVNRKPEGEDFTLEFPPHVPVSESNWIKAIYRWATGNTN